MRITEWNTKWHCLKWWGAEVLSSGSLQGKAGNQKWNSILSLSPMTRAWMHHCSTNMQLCTPRYCFRFHDCVKFPDNFCQEFLQILLCNPTPEQQILKRTKLLVWGEELLLIILASALNCLKWTEGKKWENTLQLFPSSVKTSGLLNYKSFVSTRSPHWQNLTITSAGDGTLHLNNWIWPLILRQSPGHCGRAINIIKVHQWFLHTARRVMKWRIMP